MNNSVDLFCKKKSEELERLKKKKQNNLSKSRKGGKEDNKGE